MVEINKKHTLHRLIVVCKENEKLIAYALKDELNVPVEMGVIMEVNTMQDAEYIFDKFSGVFDIIVWLMSDQSRGDMNNMLNSNEYIIKKRALSVIPVMFGRFIIPFGFFTTFPVVSNTGDIRALAENVSKVIKNYLHINLMSLMPFAFENLVKDVLKVYHFENITLTYSDHVDFGYDMMCTYDKGSEIEKGDWLVEIKYTKEERFTIRNIDALIKQDRGHYLPDNKLMLVTNGIMTSVIVEYVESLIDNQKLSIYIVDGWKLCNLIAFNDELVKAYFPYE